MRSHDTKIMTTHYGKLLSKLCCIDYHSKSGGFMFKANLEAFNGFIEDQRPLKFNFTAFEGFLSR